MGRYPAWPTGSKVPRYISIALLLLSFGSAARSQYEQATITGAAHDPQGRAVPGARIRIQQTETGLIRTTDSTGAGVFFLSGLPLGTYTFVASHDGFGEVRLTGIRLAVGQTRTVDVIL